VLIKERNARLREAHSFLDDEVPAARRFRTETAFRIHIHGALEAPHESAQFVQIAGMPTAGNTGLHEHGHFVIGDAGECPPDVECLAFPATRVNEIVVTHAFVGHQGFPEVDVIGFVHFGERAGADLQDDPQVGIFAANPLKLHVTCPLDVELDGVDSRRDLHHDLVDLLIDRCGIIGVVVDGMEKVRAIHRDDLGDLRYRRVAVRPLVGNAGERFRTQQHPHHELHLGRTLLLAEPDCFGESVVAGYDLLEAHEPRDPNIGASLFHLSVPLQKGLMEMIHLETTIGNIRGQLLLD